MSQSNTITDADLEYLHQHNPDDIIDIETGEIVDKDSIPKEQLPGDDFANTMQELQDTFAEMEDVKAELAQLSDLGIEMLEADTRYKRRQLKKKLKLLEKKKRMAEHSGKTLELKDPTIPEELTQVMDNVSTRSPFDWDGKVKITR